MNHKTLCWDLEKACAKRGTPIRIAISVEPINTPSTIAGIAAFRGFTATVRKTSTRYLKTLSGLKGVEAILTQRPGPAFP